MPVFLEFPDFLGTGLLRIGIGSYDRSALFRFLLAYYESDRAALTRLAPQQLQL